MDSAIHRKCHAKTYCKQSGILCDKYCVGFNQLQTIYELSQIPKKYQFDKPLHAEDDDFEAFKALNEFKLDVEERIANGEGLFLISKRKGTGKTSWVTKIANEYIRKVALTNNLRTRVLFINVPEFLERVKESFNSKDEELDRISDDIKTADLVIWDDIGTETHTKWVRTRLYSYINYRDGEMLSNFYTSNVPMEALESDDMLGDRIASRILGHSELFEFVGRIDNRRTQE